MVVLTVASIGGSSPEGGGGQALRDAAAFVIVVLGTFAAIVVQRPLGTRGGRAHGPGPESRASSQ